jgi:hypothetical protein
MDRVPVFIEVADRANANICESAARALINAKLKPVGFARTLAELADVLKALKTNNVVPAVYIINTFKARDILPHLDPMMGETPAVFLRRSMFLGQSGLMDHLATDPNQPNTIKLLTNMTPRLTSIWRYGAKNATQVAQKIVACTQKFCADGNFRHYEIANKSTD